MLMKKLILVSFVLSLSVVASASTSDDCQYRKASGLMSNTRAQAMPKSAPAVQQAVREAPARAG